MSRTIILLAGPNGAGKSTLYQTRVAPAFVGPFVNADIIQRDELDDTAPKPLTRLRKSLQSDALRSFPKEVISQRRRSSLIPRSSIWSEKRGPEDTPSG